MKPFFINLLFVVFLFVSLETAARYWLKAAPLIPGAVLSMTVHHALDIAQNTRQDFLPLAGMSNRDTWLCNEDSGTIMFHSDRHGFNNNDSTWDKPVDTVLIGDSFVQGYCVPREFQIATLLQARGENVLNLALKGTGPFSQLGVVREYALMKNPRRIVWFILANDVLYDLDRELRQPVLVSYFKGFKGFKGQTQNLALRQDEVDHAVSLMGAEQPLPHGPLLYFPNAVLRLLFRLFRPEPLRPLEFEIASSRLPEKRIQLFADILAKARDYAGNGKIDFIFIPDSWVFTKKTGHEVRAIVARLKEAMQARDLTLIDPTAEYDRTRQPLSKFAPLDGYYGHYNAEGFRILEKSVPPLSRLKLGGY